MEKRKIAVITGTRSEYGILCPVLKAIKKHPKLELSLIVGGMHLSHEFGYTIEEIERDGFLVDAKFDILLSDDTGARMARSIGVGVLEFTQIFEMLKPDIILVYGDREEAFVAAIAGMCLNIPVAHAGGGEVAAGGHIDEAIRHSLTKIAHIHFPATQNSVERIIRLGEESWRVHKVGSPAIDNILNEEMLSSEELKKKFSLDLSKPIILVVQHSLTTAPEDSAKQMEETMEAIKDVGQETVLIYPNADAGGKKMIQVIKKYEKCPFLKTFKSISSRDYLSLMKEAAVMVGNSSSGIIEAPSFKLPVVNIGQRQEGRERANNIIEADYDKEQIKEAIKKAVFNKEFRAEVERCQSPYGDGKTSCRIATILSEIKIDKKVLNKKITY